MKFKFTLILALFLLAAPAFAQMNVTETFESYPGPSQWWVAETIRLGLAKYSGGHTRTNTSESEGTVYGTFGAQLNNTGTGAVYRCSGCQPVLQIEFDEPIKAFELDVFLGIPGTYRLITDTGQSLSLSSTGPFQWKRKVNTGFSDFRSVRIEAHQSLLSNGRYGQHFQWYMAIDNVHYTTGAPLRISTGPGVDPSGASVEKLVGDDLEIKYPLGSPFFLKIQQKQDDGTWKTIPASYTLSEDIIQGPHRFSTRLFPSYRVFAYGGTSNADYKTFQTVHLGGSTIRVFPQDTRLSTFDIKLKTVEPSSLGVTNGLEYDAYFTQVADATGIPPQYLKAQSYQESHFNPFTWRYEALTVDYYQVYNNPPSQGGPYLSRSPWSNYIIKSISPVQQEGRHLCPVGAFTAGTLPHDCGFTGIDDLAPRSGGPPYLNIVVCPNTTPRRIVGNDGFNEPLTIRNIYNASVSYYRFDGVDPAPGFGPTVKPCVTSTGRRRAVGPTDPLIKTAQTPLASSYGLLQTVAAHVIDRPVQWGGVPSPGRGNRHNPSLLFDTPENIQNGSGSVWLGAQLNTISYIRRTGRTADNVSFASLEAFETAMRSMIQGYNPGDPNYVSNVFRYVSDYMPTLPFGTFPVRHCEIRPTLSHTQSASVQAGQRVYLGVTVNGNVDVYSYQWYRGTSGNTSNPVPNGDWRLLSFVPASSASYWVRVETTCGPVDSATIPVTIRPFCGVPVFTQHPSNATITEGESVTLRAAAFGATTIEWYEGQGPAMPFDPGDRTNRVGTGNELTVTPTETSQYWALAYNSCGEVTSTTAAVTVLPCVQPSITSQPEGRSITKGESAPLSLVATGNLPLTISWFTTGGASVGSGASISVTPNTTTSYYARVANACGSVTTNVVTIVVCTPASIATQPSSATIIEGQSAPLSVTANGSAPLTYQWFTSAGAFAGSGASISVSPSQTTSYYARVTNACGETQSATVTITVTPACVAPSIGTQPVGGSIVSGQSASLSVSANGTAQLSYQWFTTTGAPVANGASISVSPTTTTSYFARVTNSCGAVDSNAVTVTVTAGCTSPAIEAQPVSTTIVAGQNATLSVTATGTAPLTYQWFTASGAPAGSGPTLTVSPTTTSSYYVTVSNACGSVQSGIATVTVACAAPSITVQPSSVTITSGQSTALTVTAGGTAPLTYQWYTANGTPLGTAASQVVSPTSTTSYYVRVLNSCGSVQSQTVTVTVVGSCTPPSVTTQPSGASIIQGQSVALSVNGAGTPPIGIDWFATNSSTPIGTGPSITVTPTQTTTYYAELTNSCGTTRSDQVTVNVCLTPSIANQPQDKTIIAGQSFSIGVVVDAHGLGHSFQWYRGASGNTASPISGATSPTLQLTPTATDSYWVRTATACGSTVDSRAAIVTVNPCLAPTVTIQPENAVYIEEGGTGTLSVSASGSALAYQWYRSEPTGAPFVAITGATSPTLAVPRPDTTSQYYVRITNPCGTVQSHTVTAYACEAVRITQQPQSTTIDAGAYTWLSIEAEGTDVTYRWLSSTDGNHYSIFAQGPLVYVSPLKTSYYYVDVSGPCGFDRSEVITVTVNGCIAPRVLEHPQSATIQAGQSVTLSGSGDGGRSDVQRWYQWYESNDGVNFWPKEWAGGPSITVSPSSTMYYKLMVGNYCTDVFSDVAQVTVLP